MIYCVKVSSQIDDHLQIHNKQCCDITKLACFHGSGRWPEQWEQASFVTSQHFFASFWRQMSQSHEAQVLLIYLTNSLNQHEQFFFVTNSTIVIKSEAIILSYHPCPVGEEWSVPPLGWCNQLPGLTNRLPSHFLTRLMFLNLLQHLKLWRSGLLHLWRPAGNINKALEVIIHIYKVTKEV